MCTKSSKKNSAGMSGYKHVYFPIRGRGERTRLAFAAAKIDFEDIRLPFKEWPKERASGRPPLGLLPYIVTPEGGVLGEAGAITKYICKKGGLCPADGFDEAIADMISDGATDLAEAVIKMHFEKDEAKKKELQTAFFETTLPARLEKFEAILKGRNEGKGFFFGDKLTYADITFFDFFNNFLFEDKSTEPESLKKFPLLMGHYNRMLDVPEISAWIKKRPKTEK